MQSTRPPAWKTLAAFSVIYFVWGSTYLAIRVGVREFPPLLMAGLRFVIAGAVLYAWAVARREPAPTRRQWISASLLSILFFVMDYGLVFWAEQRVPSGITAVMMATIPAFIAFSEIFFLRTQALTFRLAFALLIGIGGVAVLMSRSLYFGGAPIDLAGAIAIIVASLSWAIATALTRKVSLPPSKVVSSAVQMFSGGVLLLLTSAAFREFGRFHPRAISLEAWLSLVYLIVAGSIVAFTVYLWLIDHHSPTKVGTYAYVNPIVAVIVGYFLGGEPLGMRTILGTILILISVVFITTSRAKKSAAPIGVPENLKAAD